MNSVVSFDHLVGAYPNRSWHFEAAARTRIEVGTSRPDAFALESFSSFVISTPTRRDRPLCCARAVNGHAAAPSPAMKSRRLRTFVFSLSRTGLQRNQGSPVPRSGSGPLRRLTGEQSTAALPGYFRHQFSRQSQLHRRSRCQGNERCSRSSNGLAKAGPHANFQLAGRSESLWFGARSACRT